MFKFIKKSFKAKIVLIITISIFFSGTAISAIMIKSQYDSQLAQMKIDGFNIARIIAKNIESASVDSSQEKIQKIVDEFGNSEGIQYTALIDENMVDVIDNQEEEIGKSFADDAETIDTVKGRIETTSFYIDPTGSEVLDIMVPVNFKVDDRQIAAVDIGISMDNLYDNIHKSIIKSCILTFVFIIIFTIILIIVVNIIVVKPLNEGVRLATAIADKNLRLSISSNSEDEIGTIINSIEQAKNNLKDIISETQLSTVEVTSASEILQLSLDSIAIKTQNMAMFVDNIYENIEEDICIIKEKNIEIEDMVSNSNEIEEINMQASNYMKNVNKYALQSKMSMEEVTGIISVIESSSRDATDLVLELRKETVKIGQVTNVILDSMKNLTEESGQSLDSIIELTKNIENKADKAIEIFSIAIEKINEGAAQSNIAGENIDKIIEEVLSVENAIEIIANMTITQSQSIKKIQEFMGKIILTSKVKFEKAQEMNIDIEEQMSIFQEISAISDELENMSIKLTSLVNQFKVY